MVVAEHTPKSLGEQPRFSEAQQLFLSAIEVPTDDPRLNEHDLRAITDVFFYQVLQPLQPSGKKPETERDIIVKVFSQLWTPTSRNEARMVAIDEESKLSKASRAKKGSPSRTAVTNVHETVRHVWIESINDSAAIREPREACLDNPEDLPDAIRDDSKVLARIVRNLRSREFMDQDKWPRRNSKAYKERQQFWQGAVECLQLYASNSTVLNVYNWIDQETDNRRVFWTPAYNLLGQTPIVRLVTGDPKYVPTPHLENLVEAPFIATTEGVNRTGGTEPRIEKGGGIIFRTPKEALRQSTVAEVTRVTNKEHQEGGGFAARLQNFGPRAVTGRLPGEKPRPRVEKKKEPKRWEKPIRRYISPKDTGPPLDEGRRIRKNLGLE